MGCVLGWSAGPVAELTDIAVHHQHMQKGGGTRLLRSFLEEMRRRGVEEVQLDVRENNQAAIALYTAFQFKVVGRRTDYYADGEDALLYSLFF